MLKISSIRLMAAAVAATALASGCATQSSVKSALAPLPETVTSFGAVTSDGWLYAFGGHKGERHDYSFEMVSGSFQRLKLSDGQKWEKLPSAAPGQGLALVAYNGELYRVGGMAARNHEAEHDTLTKQKLYSLPLVQRFNPRDGRWEDLAPLPSPRSSHDAVVLGHKLYVAGGWDLSGSVGKPVWHTNALVLDLDQPQAGWREFPQPFQRRGLALAALGTQVFCIGGMSSDNETSLAVDIYDTATGRWSKGPDLPDGQYKGFSCSAIAQNGHVYAATLKGDLLRLSDDERSWEVVGRLEHPRMAYRLVTAGKSQLIALGGEDGEEEKIPGLELLTPSAKPLPATPVAATAQVSNLH
jgi:N-acetylneuraminic acid mutarotase